MMKRNSNDHWDFLEEIEAPMWVDLTLHANINNQDGDDDWFYRSHLFHQCSSRELKTAFSHSGEESAALNFDLLGPSSPKLPSSVSRSRGKNYVSKKWREDNQVFPIDKRHPVNVLSGTSSCVNSGSGDNMKSKPSLTHLKGTCRAKTSWVCKSSAIGNGRPSCSMPISSCGDSTSTLSSRANKADESNTASTITYESRQQQQQNMGKSSRPLSQSSGLLSLTKTGMRKSCVTRQASRVEINGDRRQSRGRNSSSGKSSVGSSSNPCYDGRSSTSTSMQYKERTPDIRNMTIKCDAAKNKIKFSIASKTSTHKIEQGTSTYRMGPNIAKSTYQQAAKPKTLKRKPLGPVRVKETKLITATLKSKEKPVVGGSYRLAASRIDVKVLAASGEENIVKGRAAGSRTQKCNSKGVAAVTMVTGHKGTKHSILQGHDKKTGKENVGVKSRWVNVMDIYQRPHFR